jgi:hypothetical protein
MYCTKNKAKPQKLSALLNNLLREKRKCSHVKLITESKRRGKMRNRTIRNCYLRSSGWIKQNSEKKIIKDKGGHYIIIKV